MENFKYNFNGLLPFGYLVFQTDDIDVMSSVISEFAYKVRSFNNDEDEKI